MDYSCYVNKGTWVSQQKYRRRSSDPSIFDYVEGLFRFVVETDQPDDHGTVVDLAGIAIPEQIPILINFRNADLICYCKVWVAGGLLICEAMLEDCYLDFYPAIGFSAIKYRTIEGKKYHEQIKLYCVGLCVKPNLNPTIKTIREQIKEQG